MDHEQVRLEKSRHVSGIPHDCSERPLQTIHDLEGNRWPRRLANDFTPKLWMGKKRKKRGELRVRATLKSLSPAKNLHLANPALAAILLRPSIA